MPSSKGYAKRIYITKNMKARLNIFLPSFFIFNLKTYRPALFKLSFPDLERIFKIQGKTTVIPL
jgi:hypothetical protein